MIFGNRNGKAGKKCNRLGNNEYECQVKEKKKVLLAIPEFQSATSPSLIITETGEFSFTLNHKGIFGFKEASFVSKCASCGFSMPNCLRREMRAPNDLILKYIWTKDFIWMYLGIVTTHQIESKLNTAYFIKNGCTATFQNRMLIFGLHQPGVSPNGYDRVSS